MPTVIKGETYYRTSEASKMAGITRSTLLRWLTAGILEDVRRRDRRGWRLFSEAVVKRIKDEAEKLK